MDQDGQITFLDWTKIKRKNGKKYIEVDWNEYYEWRSGMNWLGYEYGINNKHEWYLFIWNYKKGAVEWQWTITWANWDKYEWNWKNHKRESWKFTIRSEWDKVYDVKMDKDLLKITWPAGDPNVGKYIDTDDGNKIKDVPSS